ncbi:hypothetical protein [Parendozoicomonas sp. Alg238-R29]|uniref:hypothetical protein n=1 Tax=Parendozoicomonas sp. Alg238-R29 TaxID=2993446 RepID=UPI00248E3569|nr:hypothetical protein [Parendozoicomonas sp. Alg238-R29]
MTTATRLRGHASSFADQALTNVDVARAMGMADGLVRHWQEKRYQAGLSHHHASDLGEDFQALGQFLRPALQVAMLCAGAEPADDRRGKALQGKALWQDY